MFRSVLKKALSLTFAMAVVAASAHAWEPENRLMFLTFSRPVALPGATLEAGTYAFEILNAASGNDVVAVRDKARRHVYYTGLTLPMDRPAGMDPSRLLLFGEAKAGDPPRILAWFPRDVQQGREFVYRK